jgi:hypothetical protein
LDNPGPKGGAPAVAKKIEDALKTGLDTGIESRAELVKLVVAAETKRVSNHIIFTAMIDAKEDNLGKLKNHPGACDKAMHKHFSALIKEMPHIFKAVPGLLEELHTAVRKDLAKDGFIQPPPSERAGHNKNDAKPESNTGTGGRSKPSAAGSKPSAAMPTASTEKMDCFVNSAQEVIDFVKDQGLDQDNGYFQKHSEKLTAQINTLNVSPGDLQAAKKAYRSAILLSHPDKLQEHSDNKNLDMDDVMTKGPEAFRALDTSYKTLIS